MAMAERTITCGECRASQTFRGTEEQIRAALEEWERGHEQAVHDGEEVSAWEID
jgi:hypothetical protein